MRRITLAVAFFVALSGAFVAGRGTAAASIGAPRSYYIEHDAEVARRQAGPHHGTGWTTGYSFFEDVEGVPFVFRKRALHPGASIGYHPHGHDEIYYVLSGRGELTMDGATSTVEPGTAILIRDGSSHGLRQVGDEDLVILITYPG